MTMSAKLRTLAEDEGFDSCHDLCEANVLEGVVPGICMNHGCNYSCGVEPDSRDGWCDECQANSVMSCLELYLQGGWRNP